MAALALSAIGGHAAQAQSIGPLIQEPKDVPGRRIIPEYAPVGFELSGFDILPAVMFGAYADDNVFTRTSVKEADLALVAEPRLRIRKEDKVQNVALDASARRSAYVRLDDQSSTEYRFEGTYTRGTTSPDSVSANAGYRREAIQRGTVENDLAGGEPLMRRVLQGSITGRKQLNRLSINLQALAVRQRYEDVSSGARVLNQQFRNVTRYGLHGIASFELSTRTSLFGSAEYDKYDYARSPLLANRDAGNWSGTAGVSYQITRLLYAQLSLGYRRYDFKERSLGAIGGVAVAGHLRYFPSRVLAIRGVVEQSNTTSPYDLVGAVTLTTARVEVEYEMRRSVSWLAATKFTMEDYAKQNYAGRRFEVTAGPRLRFNRWLSAEATAGFAKRFVNGRAPFEPYTQVYGVVSLTFSR